MIQKLKILPRSAWLAQLLVLGAALFGTQLDRLNAQESATASKDELFHRIVASVQHGDFDDALASSGVALRGSGSRSAARTAAGGACQTGRCRIVRT